MREPDDDTLLFFAGHREAYDFALIKTGADPQTARRE